MNEQKQNVTKINDIIKVLEELKEEERNRVNKIKSDIITMLGEKQYNYYLIQKEHLSSEFTVYGTSEDEYSKAQDKFTEIMGSELVDENIILHKDELENLLYTIKYCVKSNEDVSNTTSNEDVSNTTSNEDVTLNKK